MKRSTSQPAQLLCVFTGQQTLTIQTMPDGRVLDGSGLTVGKFDANRHGVVADELNAVPAEPFES